MKSNVDLTLDRIFNQNTFDRVDDDIGLEIFKLFTNKKVFPWVSGGMALVEVVEDDASLNKMQSDEECFRVPLVITGDGETRKEKMRRSREDNLDICSCCAKRCYKWPWSNEHNCSCNIFDNNEKVFPWNKIKSNDIALF